MIDIDICDGCKHFSYINEYDGFKCSLILHYFHPFSFYTFLSLPISCHRIEKQEDALGDGAHHFGMGCQGCGDMTKLSLEDSRTQYVYDDKDPTKNPNRELLLCISCGLEHHQHWDEMWSEYYSSIM